MNTVVLSTEERLQLHREFWDGPQLNRPLVSFRIGGYFIADKFNAAQALLVPGKRIEPHMIVVEDFLEDYERMFTQIESIGQDGFWVAEPYAAIPWTEAMLGCNITALKESFVSEPALTTEEDIYSLNITLEGNLWFEKYMEFVRKLCVLSGGRFAIGQPILRGISEGLGSLLGQTKMVYELYDQPEKIKVLTGAVENLLLKLIEEQNKIIPLFLGGAALGFYHVWTPRKCMWFQEDLTALFSPEAYREFVKPHNEATCNNYRYNAIHLHSSSFHILNDLLSIKCLKAVEINKDVGGPTIPQMITEFNKVLAAGKKLIIWGMLTKEDLLAIRSEVDWRRGVFLCIVTESLENASELLDFVRSWE